MKKILPVLTLVAAVATSLAATANDSSKPAMAVPVLAAVYAAAPVPAKDAATLKVDEALDALADRITHLSDDRALRVAFQAYYNFKAKNPGRVRNPYYYFVDYGLDNRTARGYVFDMERLELVEGPFIVAHGRGSSAGKNGVPTLFSNRHGSASTSLGLYVAQETYGFSGKAGGQHYTSIGLRMAGVSGSFNDNARSRGVVAHGAPYVTPSGAGRSEGCPAMDQARARRLLPKLANGGLVFLFSPRDRAWLQQDPWINA